MGHSGRICLLQTDCRVATTELVHPHGAVPGMWGFHPKSGISEAT